MIATNVYKWLNVLPSKKSWKLFGILSIRNWLTAIIWRELSSFWIRVMDFSILVFQKHTNTMYHVRCIRFYCRFTNKSKIGEIQKLQIAPKTRNKHTLFSYFNFLQSDRFGMRASDFPFMHFIIILTDTNRCQCFRSWKKWTSSRTGLLHVQISINVNYYYYYFLALFFTEFQLDEWNIMPSG